MSEHALEVDALYVSYGPIRAVRGCSFRVGPGEAVTIVGANGAGKTTIMRALSGLIAPSGGRIALFGADTTRMPACDVARAGVLHVPEGRGILGRLTVIENLRLAYDARPAKKPFHAAIQMAFDRFPRLRERSRQTAGLLSGGEQQMLALAKAIVNPPRLLLVDEPSLGLAPLVVKEAFAVLAEFRAAGMAILLVEQNVRVALQLAHRAYVLRQGEIMFEGSAAELGSSSDLKAHLIARKPIAH